jgi:hypothetical protein
MRGCLFILVLAAGVIGAVAWFGSPVLASVVIDSALRGAGYEAATSTVTATADPPPKLLTGRADRVRIQGSDVDFRTFHAANLDLVLTGVDLLGRSAATIRGRIDGAELRTSDGVDAVADVTIDGPGDGAAAAIVVAGDVIERLVRAGFQREFGIEVGEVRLVEPDVLRVSARGTTLEGRLEIDDEGALALSTPLGSSTLLRFDSSFPLRLRSVSADDGDLQVTGTLDAADLLGG